MIKRNANVKNQKASRRLIALVAALLAIGVLACWAAAAAPFVTNPSSIARPYRLKT